MVGKKKLNPTLKRPAEHETIGIGNSPRLSLAIIFEINVAERQFLIRSWLFMNLTQGLKKMSQGCLATPLE